MSKVEKSIHRGVREMKTTRERAQEIVSQMTLEEKASQLKYDSAPIKRLNIPAYNWWNESLHGVARAGVSTMFPQAIGLAALFDEEMLERVAEVIALEGRAKYNAFVKKEDRDIYKGITFWAPNVNIFRDPRWGRGHETYGEDPYLSSKLGVAYIKGLQGDGKYLKTAACVKHFAVHSGPEECRHHFNAEVSKKDLYETYLPAFEACVKEGKVAGVMGAYNRVNGEPACGSQTLLRSILREKWGFEGYIVSDCWAIKDFHTEHRVTSTAPESAALALKMTCDLNCGNTYLHILAAHQQGLVTEKDIEEAAVRLMEIRLRLGMFDEDCIYDEIAYDVVDCKEHQALALETARKSMVMLKNDNILPLNLQKIKTIGVIGPTANKREVLEGNYNGTASRYITFVEGIQDYVGDSARVYYAEGCHLFKESMSSLSWKNDRIAEALTVAEESDVVVLCLGLDSSIEGEQGDTGNAFAGGDKVNLDLIGNQQHLLEKVVAIGKPTILILSTGSAMAIGFAKEHCQGIIQTWYPGAKGGKALAELLFGAYSPSGKLPVTFYKTTEELPDFKAYSMKNRTYRFMEQEALYPFGFGLTYGKIRIKEVVFEKETMTQGEDITVKIKLENEGEIEAGEVVQVYIKDLDSPYAVQNYSLCGFKKVDLKKGEEKEIALSIKSEAFRSIDEAGEACYAGEHYRLYVGTCQPDDRSQALTGNKPFVYNIMLKK